MDDKIEYLWSTGMDAEEIAEQLGVPKDFVEDAVKRLNLEE